MNPTAPERMAALGRQLAANAERVCKDCGVTTAPDLMVESGETVMVSPEAGRFKSTFRSVKAQSIDEVRKLMGVQKPAGASASPCGCSKNARYYTAEDLEAEDEASRGKALSTARAAARSYVMAGATATANQKAMLDRYVQISQAVINIAFLQDIEVQSGATLVVAANTHALYARKVRIHGTGRIVCHGPTTINCTSMEGDFKKIKWSPVALTDAALVARQPKEVK